MSSGAATKIDWKRIARPQPDGYDIEILCDRFKRIHCQDIAGDVKIFDGWVRARKLVRPVGSGLVAGSLNHPNIQVAENLLALWPEGYQSFARLMRVFYPLEYETEVHHGRGSTCGSDDNYLGEMYATTYSAPGLAEAFVHELGHTKLRYLGVFLERADRLITNDPRELFESPIRKDKLRPMTAVFHAQFSYSYVTHLDLTMLAAQPDDIGHRQAIEVNYKRLYEGKAVIEGNLKPDTAGEDFFIGYFDWLNEILRECEIVLGLGE